MMPVEPLQHEPDGPDLLIRAKTWAQLPRLAACFCILIGVIGILQMLQGLPTQGMALTEGSMQSGENPAQLSVAMSVQQGVGGEEPDYLMAAVVPHTTVPRRYRIDPITYTVQPGDNPWNIGQSFGVSEATILWANVDLEDNPDFLAIGDELVILPVSGVYHTVVKSDTVESIAKFYGVQVEDITSYEGNYLSEPYTISVGQKLIVPGGRKPYRATNVRAWTGDVPKDAKKGTGVFGYPMSGIITQRYSEFHQALDIAAPQGTRLQASDSGYVAVVGRVDTGYGLYVIIDHGNGFQTLYAHFSVTSVSVGQSVSKGQTLGLCGSTGKSTGPHVHFEIRENGVRRNPMLYLK